MHWFMLLALLWQPAPAPVPANTEPSPVPAAPADVESDAWVQEARDWLVAVRVAYEKMTPAQTQALSRSFEKLPPAALRVLLTVYEHTYGVQSPLSAADRRPPDATEAEREWIMAYRILYDRLSVEDAQAYAKTLRSMTPNQIRALLAVYQEKNRQQALRPSNQIANNSPSGNSPSANPAAPSSGRTADEEAAARRAMEVAQSRMEFEEMRRGMALGRASVVRSDTKQAMVAANATTAVTAAGVNQRIRDQEAISQMQSMQHNSFQNQMYERNTYPNGYAPYFYRIY